MKNKVNTYAWVHFGIDDEDDLSNMLDSYVPEIHTDISLILYCIID